MFVQNMLIGLRTTTWSKLIKDVGAIVLVLLTPYVVQRIYSGVEYELTIDSYINAIFIVSPLVAICMVLVLNYRLYRAGCLSSPGER